jgi:type IV secretion system protein VirB4
VQCFDFQGVNNEQYADLIEPLMVWLLRRINDVLYAPVNLGVTGAGWQLFMQRSGE